ncbi:uncharacterized protein LOC123556357 isoform X5 [Mercenaria mercenaria]|uniref:uncharacterized protein LOC123556357 isoform X5 n=1 Tax=Mercenaria mercenaria TaxID=6596 RepID=UPI00234FA5D2|nr:uncharacterized protein LOC123556357 isoform X5 [Mercenaria mercenaria]
MAVVANPYTQQHAQLGLIEAGLKTLKNDKSLMSDAEFSDMYWAVERHHRDLRLAHLTGKAKDLMEQAEKDTKFYNILIKMLCEVKNLPRKKKKETVHKVHNWYVGNRHTLATGPRFGKSTPRSETRDGLKTDHVRTKSAKLSYRSSKSATSTGRKQSNKENEATPREKDFKQFMSETRDDVSSMHGVGESMNPPSEPASSRLSVFGNDFLTNRFMMDLPSSKLSWHLDTPLGKTGTEMVSSPTDWDCPDLELQRIGESSLSRPTFDEHFHASHPSVPNSSPQSHPGDGSPRSVGSGGSDGNASSGVDVGSADMMDFHSDVRRRLSHGVTSTCTGMQGMSDDQSYTGGYGLPRKMVHSIASLVNPHAKLAESEARKMEQEYLREQIKEQMSATPHRTSNKNTSAKGPPDLSAHIPVLRTVSVSSNRGENVKAFNSFKHDHLYGQDILSPQRPYFPRPHTTQVFPPIRTGKLNFVGRSGTALDVRYSAHAQGDQPEQHTKSVIQLYGMTAKDEPKPHAKQSESRIHNQTLEEFYQAAENYSPSHLSMFRSTSRTQSAPAPRVKSSKSIQSGAKTVQPRRQSPGKSQTTPKLGKSLLDNKFEKSMNDEDEEEDEILYSSATERPKSAVKLEAVVNMIDQVKDEMNFFREKLAPAPMPGFRQPASTQVSNKPLSRPTSTASHRSRPRSSQVRPRSPSPQGRPSTPQEPDDILMGQPEVPADTFKTVPLNRPHSASVNKAVDWRGKVTPESTRIRSKTRFGGHSYVQKLKPSLRTAGATSAGTRPKTAPISMKDRWNSKDKEENENGDSLKLPEVKIQNYPSVVSNYPCYPVKHRDDKPPALITITECDKNERVSSQAASNTMTQVDDQDMDRIMSIQHLLGSSDSRYGSMGSLFLDEDFLRSMNSRYSTATSMSHMTSQSKEYLSFVAPKTPRQSPIDARSLSKQSIRKPDVINQIPEELSDLGEDLQYTDSTANVPPLQLEQVDNENLKQKDQVSPQGKTLQQSPVVDGVLPEQEVKVTEEITRSEVIPESEDKVGEQLTPEGVTEVKVTEIPKKSVDTAREIVHVESEDKEGGVHIEVTAVPAIGRPRTPPNDTAIEELTESETWHYQPQPEEDDTDTDVNLNVETDLVNKTQSTQQHHHAHHRHDLASRQSSSAKSIVKPENYCFHCVPDNMSSKVGRSAGRMPGTVQSPAGQVLRMARRQNEYFKKAPPVRTPPSIPSTHHLHSAKSPRHGQQYSTELEHHARKVKSPRHFMEQGKTDEQKVANKPEYIFTQRGNLLIVELRKDNCRSAPPGSCQDSDGIMDSLSIISLRTPSRAHTAPTMHTQKTSETLGTLPAHAEETDPTDDGSTATDTPEVIYARPSALTRARTDLSQQSLAHVGRPIPQVSHVPDPIEVEEAVMKQQEAKAAVDIQRIFRGYVCRNSYRKLLWENRKDIEDKQMALQESQREYRKHKGRKAKIYNRPPLDPELLQWAKDFKEIQVQHAGKRQMKVDAMAKEMLANQQKAKSKIEVIGPHVEIYDIYHPKETGPSQREMHKAAVHIQKHVRGFLVRRRFEKLRRKATFCGSTWEKMVKDYKNLLVRVQRWHGVEKPVTPFSLQEMHEYMDMRRRFESQFDKKAFGSEMELGELEAFFRECDLYPSRAEIDEGLDVTTKGQSIKKGNGLKKHEAMNLLFYIYVPKATGLTDTRQSTWMNPIINGVEAKKLIGSEFVEGAPLKPCADLVIQSRKERRMKEEEEKERLREKEQKAKGERSGGDSDSDGQTQTARKKSTGKLGTSASKGPTGTKLGQKKKK